MLAQESAVDGGIEFQRFALIELVQDAWVEDFGQILSLALGRFRFGLGRILRLELVKPAILFAWVCTWCSSRCWWCGLGIDAGVIRFIHRVRLDGLTRHRSLVFRIDLKIMDAGTNLCDALAVGHVLGQVDLADPHRALVLAFINLKRPSAKERICPKSSTQASWTSSISANR